MTTPTFTLSVNNIDLTLVEFDGTEQLNRLFQYTFTCEIPQGKSISEVIDGDAEFTIKKFDDTIHDQDVIIKGYISSASKSNGYWQLVLKPKINKATTNRRAEIYFSEAGDLTVENIIKSEFDNDILLNDRTAVFDFTTTLPDRKLFCQMHESNFAYVARLCDHWGIHFYFDHFNQQLVFADNNSYDSVIDSIFGTTGSTAENSLLKVQNWVETVVPEEYYFTITGHDHSNARTTIEASFPEDGTRPASLTERKITMADVNSQDEAEYIAQVQYEAANCLNQKSQGTVKVPYLFPGFKLRTDDSDFNSALVIKTTLTGRNLNSNYAQIISDPLLRLFTTPDAPASFSCDFEAIPSSVLFRPDNFHAVPTATDVYGKIISETGNMSVAQRNGSGEYKVELLGFDNENSIHPWLRKAQATAGSNNVDVPLLPDTEVLVSFVDGNPNCPYIQNAVENSLQPAPVTNANPHHAVVKTGGMLVTSSLEGRYDYTITDKTLEIDNTYQTEDADVSDSVKNYFKKRDRFDQNTNFIDPSVDNDRFSDADESSGDYIFTRFSGDSVEVRQGDKLHWHNGNLYDFGGYWNYNLGNSYEENFIDQESPLNITVQKDSRSGDILKETGPDWKEIEFSDLAKNGLSESDVKPASYGDTAITTNKSGKTFKVNTGGAWNSGGMNVTKDYNASYDYKFGEGIEISDRVNSLEVTHTDGSTEAVDMNFHKGVLRSWEKTIGRNSESKSWNGDGKKTAEESSNFDSTTTTKTEKETKWDLKGDTKISDSKTVTTANSVTTDEKSYNMDTGALSAHNIKTTNGMGNAEMDFSFDANAASKFNFGASTSFSLSAQADASLAISFSGTAAINVGFGLAFELKTGAEAGMELDLRTGIESSINSKGKMEVSGIGFKARAEARAEAAKKAVAMESLVTELNQCAMALAYTDVKLMKVTLQLKAGLEITGM